MARYPALKRGAKFGHPLRLPPRLPPPHRAKSGRAGGPGSLGASAKQGRLSGAARWTPLQASESGEARVGGFSGTVALTPTHSQKTRMCGAPSSGEDRKSKSPPCVCTERRHKDGAPSRARPSNAWTGHPREFKRFRWHGPPATLVSSNGHSRSIMGQGVGSREDASIHQSSTPCSHSTRPSRSPDLCRQ